MPYNIINCAGFEGAGGLGGWVASTGCLKARLALVIVFFVVAIIRRWGGEEVGLEFSLLYSSIAGLLLYLIIITIFGNVGIAFALGIVGGLAGGYIGGYFFGGGEEY